MIVAVGWVALVLGFAATVGVRVAPAEDETLWRVLTGLCWLVALAAFSTYLLES